MAGKIPPSSSGSLMHPNLSFEQAPPLSVPYRFFMTAPWFGVAAGLLLAWQGADALASRWTPVALALTHLIVAGFMLQAMCGALLQFVPVAAGGNVRHPRALATFTHPLLALATVCLATAFITGAAVLFVVAALIFALAIGTYVIVVGYALLRTPARGATLQALRLAVAGLAVTAILGVALALALGCGWQWLFVEITNVHAAWGLGGWALTLLMGVSFHVVPMFQLTPPYPVRLAAALPLAMVVMLTLWSWQIVGEAAIWQRAAMLGANLLAAVYAATTLLLQARRRRKLVDPTLIFFRGAMVSVLLFAVSSVGFAIDADAAADPRAALWLGMLAIPGVFISAITGMLYKIVPFLNWLHLQRIGGLGIPPPNMRDMIAESAMNGQMRLHFIALTVLLLAIPMPQLTRLAGILFAASCFWLGLNLAGGLRVYLRGRKRIVANAGGGAS